MKRKKGESQYSYNLEKNSEKEYKKVLNKSMKNYIKKMTKEMKTLRYQNTKEYWQIQMKVNVDKAKIVVFF